jgi:hypothetical protein
MPILAKCKLVIKVCKALLVVYFLDLILVAIESKFNLFYNTLFILVASISCQIYFSKI